MTPFLKTVLWPFSVSLSALLFSLGCGSVSDPASVQTHTHWAKVPLAVDDVLIVTLGREGEESLSRELRIQGNGSITLPLIGSVTVAGMTCEQAAAHIKSLFVPDERPGNPMKVTVQNQMPISSITGEVKSPGRIYVMGEQTVTFVIERTGGGFTPNANRKKVRLIHADGAIEIVNCIKAESEPRYDLKVRPGDRIEVPRK